MGFFGYKDNMFVGYIKVNQIMDCFCYVEGDVVFGVEGMNCYWE